MCVGRIIASSGVLLLACLKPVDLAGVGFRCRSESDCATYGPCTRGICGGSCIAAEPACPSSSEVCEGFNGGTGPLGIDGWTVRIESDGGIAPLAGRVDQKGCDQTPSAYLSLEEGRRVQLERQVFVASGGTKELHLRSFFYLPAAPAPTADVELVNVLFGTTHTRFVMSSAGNGLYVFVGDGGAIDAGQLPRDRWFCFEASVLGIDNDGSPGLVRARVDDRLFAVEAYATDAVGHRSPQVIAVGLRSDAPRATPAELWLDNLVVAESEIDCDPYDAGR